MTTRFYLTNQHYKVSCSVHTDYTCLIQRWESRYYTGTSLSEKSTLQKSRAVWDCYSNLDSAVYKFVILSRIASLRHEFTEWKSPIFRERETVLWFFELLMQTGGAQYCNYIFGLSAQCCNFSVGQDIRKFKKDTLKWWNCVTKYGMTQIWWHTTVGAWNGIVFDVQYMRKSY